MSTTSMLDHRVVVPRFTPVDGTLTVAAAYTPVDNVHGPDSTYVRYFWLPEIGPSAYLAWSHLSGWLDADPARTSGIETSGGDEFTLRVSFDELARSLGISPGRLNLALGRLCSFFLAHAPAPTGDTIRVVRRAPPLSPRQLHRLAYRCPTLAAAHEYHVGPTGPHHDAA